MAGEPEAGQDPMKLMETEAAEDTMEIEELQEANIMATKAQTLIWYKVKTEMTMNKEVQLIWTGLHQKHTKEDPTQAMVVGMDNLAQVMKEVLETRIKEMTIEMAIATMIEIIINLAVVSLLEEARISKEDLLQETIVKLTWEIVLITAVLQETTGVMAVDIMEIEFIGWSKPLIVHCFKFKA